MCTCKEWSRFRTAAHDSTADHWVLNGSLLGPQLPSALQVIAEGSLQNKVFPSKRDFATSLLRGLKQWCRDNGLPSFPKQDVQALQDRLWKAHLQAFTDHINKSTITSLSSTFPGAIFDCEDKQASSLRIFCPVLYAAATTKTFMDKEVLAFLSELESKEHILTAMTESLRRQFGRSYPWAIGKGQQLPSGYILPKRRRLI